MPNKQTIISEETRKVVYDRQNGFSPFGQFLGSRVEYHHFIGSGLGEKGVGYEWNIVALTPEEHRAIHDHQPIKVYGRQRYTYDEAITIIGNHLKLNYSGWAKDKCKIKKGYAKEDYGIRRM